VSAVVIPHLAYRPSRSGFAPKFEHFPEIPARVAKQLGYKIGLCELNAYTPVQYTYTWPTFVWAPRKLTACMHRFVRYIAEIRFPAPFDDAFFATESRFMKVKRGFSIRSTVDLCAQRVFAF